MVDTTLIMSQLGKLEQHLINLIMPIQYIGNALRGNQLQETLQFLRKPITFDTRSLEETLNEFRTCMQQFRKDISEFSVKDGINELMDKLEAGHKQISEELKRK